MSETEIKRRQDYKRNRKKWIIVQAIVIFIVALFALSSFLTYDSMNKTYYIEYTESGSADYRVQYKENNFFDTEWVESGNSYVSSLINGISANFAYSLNMDTANVGFNYTYDIMAQLIIADRNTGDHIYAPTEVLMPTITEKVEGADSVKIDKNVFVDYVKYNRTAKSFVDVYELRNATSSLVVTMNVHVLSSCDEFEENNSNTYAVAITIPLGVDNFSITTSTSVADGESKVLACSGTVDQFIFLNTSVAAAILALVLLGILIVFIYATRNEDVNYTIKVQRLLSAYRSFIQQIDGEFDTTGYQIVLIKTFVEMLGIRDTIQLPVLMSENKDQTKTQFLIPTNTKLLYVFEIKVDNYDELYAKVEEPANEEPVVEELVEEEPVVEEPVVEEPVKEPVEEEPVVAEPVIVEHVVVKPVMVELIVTEPATEEPIVEEPVIEEPVEEPVAEELIEEKPIEEEPIAEEFLIVEPIIEEPIPEPMIAEPIFEEPVVEEPIVEEPIVEEPIVEEPVVEEPIVEEPIVEELIVEEPIVEEPIVEEPIVEEPIAEIPVFTENDEAVRIVNGEIVHIRYRKSFMSRLIQSGISGQNYYSAVKNSLLSYKGVKARSSWSCETFNKGRIQCAKINIRGNTLIVYLALNPAEYTDSKYRFEDVSNKPGYSRVPMMLKVKSERALKNVLTLISEMMSKLEIKQGAIQEIDYSMPYETTEALVDRGLVRVIYPSGIVIDENTVIERLDIGELLKAMRNSNSENMSIEAVIEQVMAEPDVALEDIDFVDEIDEEYVETPEHPGLEVVGVVWPERAHKNKIYRYDPNGEKLAEGDIVLVPTSHARRGSEAIRKAVIAHGNHFIDPEHHHYVLKKVIGVVKRHTEPSDE